MQELEFNLGNSLGSIQETLRYEGRLYFIASAIFAVVALGVSFIFPPGGLILGLIVLYTTYLGIRNRRGKAILFDSRILRKNWKEGHLLDGDDGEVLHFSRFEFEVEVKAGHAISNDSIEHDVVHPGKKVVFVNRALYELFQPGDSFVYVISPADDLIGYVAENTLMLAEKATSNEQKTGSLLKIAVDQTEVRRRYKWETRESLTISEGSQGTAADL